MDSRVDIVLTYAGLLIPDDSPLLQDEEWLNDVIGSVGEYDEPLLRLSLSPTLINQAAIDYIRKRKESQDALRSTGC